MIQFDTEMISQPGGRANNEDRCDSLIDGGAGCWVVADGLGGHAGGETAAQLAVDTILGSFQEKPEATLATLESAFQAANNAVLKGQESDPRLLGMRTAAAALLASPELAACAHVGDCRVYHLRGGKVTFQTRDHSVPQALCNAGEISSKELRHHPDRSRLLRSLGSEEQSKPTLCDEIPAPWAGDAFLLASDGFWEWVTETEMEIDLAKSASPRDWLRLLTSRLRDRASADHDNYTAIAVWVRQGEVS